MNTQRFLLRRPMGGLSDILCQIGTACAYAEQVGRTVIVETNYRSTQYFRDSFANYFVSRQPQLRLSSEEFTHLFDKMDVYPRGIAGRVNSYSMRYDPSMGKFGGHVDTVSGEQLVFDFKKDYAEPLLVRHAFGHDRKALPALGRMRLHDRIVDVLLRRIKKIGTAYTAVHVRHTDYKTEYEKEMEQLKDKIRGPIFVATDNRVVVDFARSVFGDDRIYSFAKLPEGEGKPIHILNARDNVYEANSDAIVDLLMLALAKRLEVFSLLPNNAGARNSGYSVLANELREVPFLLSQLISRCDETLDRLLPVYR